MAINPMISLSGKGVELQNPLDQYARVMAVQSAQNQNALGQMQLQQEKERIGAENAMNKAYSKAYNAQTGETDLNSLRASLASGGYGAKIPELEKRMNELKSQQLAQQKIQGDVLDSSLKRSRGFLDTIDPNAPDAVNQFLAWHQANHNDPIIGPALAARGMTMENSQQHVAQMLQQPGGLAQLINESKVGAEKFMELNKAQLSTQDLGGQVVSRAFNPMTGQLTTIGSDRKSLSPGQAQSLSNEARRLNLAEQAAARDADPEFQQRLAQARTAGQAMAQGQVDALQALPKVLDRAKNGINMIDELIGKRDSNGKLVGKATVHPGFETAVGATWRPGLRFVPGTDTADFMARFEQLQGTTFLEAYESLRGSGAITNIEGEKGTQAITRMSTSTSEKEFVKAAMELQDVLRKGVENARKKAGGAAKSVQPSAPSEVKFLGFE